MDHFERQLAQLMRTTEERVSFDSGQRARLRAGVKARRRMRAARLGVGTLLAVGGLGLGLFLLPAGHDRVEPSAPGPGQVTGPSSVQDPTPGPTVGTGPSPGTSPSQPPSTTGVTDLPPTSASPPPTGSATSSAPSSATSSPSGTSAPTETGRSSPDATSSSSYGTGTGTGTGTGEITTPPSGTVSAG
ncbi:hypothetical protein AB0465_28750 [Streptomyces griseoviridis]|uniref:Cellulase n=1 Tax=Streptomyces griseoviridis TaxID=45398 RepID=A0A3Q9KRU6_STRGD|nr:hypothetical protein [Streptomyces griseoviridis]AZS84601.1 hypothetical protein ELQ87_10115 [Streptomyces griseoviridis]QCN88543.1 hypothetical protein DDJ31_29195 [Streptomyces griseoviridis]